MNMFYSMLLWFSADARLAEQVASSVFDKSYPLLKRIDTASMQRDGDNMVVAVSYSTGGMRARPDPYKIFLVNPDQGTAKEVDLDAQPQFVIRGRK